jgi:hypothetical protein
MAWTGIVAETGGMGQDQGGHGMARRGYNWWDGPEFKDINLNSATGARGSPARKGHKRLF